MARYIDAEAFRRKPITEKSFFPSIVSCALQEMPDADVEEVTYCKDCEWSVKRVRHNEIFPYQCVNTIACGKPRRALDFCSYGMK